MPRLLHPLILCPLSKQIVLSLLVLICCSFAMPSLAAPYATNWVDGHNSRARLIVGGAPVANGKVQRYVALELSIPPGWKTYWRQPGSAGGVPPQLSWQGSSNLKSTAMKFPAPVRMTDPTGDTIGYKKSVVFPVAIEPENSARPVVLNLKAFFGVCRDICIPAQAAFKVTVGPDLFRQTPPELAQALTKVPAAAGGPLATGAPKLLAAKSVAMGAGKHALTFDVQFPKGTSGADLFAETGDLQSLEMAKVVARPSSDMVRYQVIVGSTSEWQALAKTGLVITMVSAAGASEARLPRP